MKRLGLISIFILGMLSLLQGQEKVLFHNGSNIIYQADVSNIDSLKFVDNVTSVFQPNAVLEFPIIGIDSITFGNAEDIGDKIYIIYNNNEVTIINPFSEQGITITADYGHVTCSSTIATPNIEYNILGNSSDGSLQLTSVEPVKLILSNLTLTNPGGAAFYIKGSMSTTFHLSSGTLNSLSDGTASTANATLLVENDVIIEGTGTLNIKGLSKHAISNGTSFVINSGAISIPQAASDGIHTEKYIQNEGNIIINTSGDGVDAGNSVEINNGKITIVSSAKDVKGIKSGDYINCNGGTVDITISGNQSKGLSANDVAINDGTLNITASGATVLEASGNGYDPSYCTGIKTKNNINILGGNLTIACPATNDGARGLSADNNIIINGGIVSVTTNGDGTTYTNETAVTDSYAPCGIKADGNISILSGNVTCMSTGKGGKGISADGAIVIGIENANNADLTVNVTTTGERFYVSGSGDNADYSNPKAVKSEGNLTVNSGTLTINCNQNSEGGEGLESKSIMYIKGGTINIDTYDDCINASNYIEISGGTHHFNARGNDGTDSNGDLTVSGGFTISSGARGAEAGFDCDNSTFKVLGGIMIGTGGSTSNPTTASSTQNSLRLTTTAGNSICIKNTSGQVVLMMQLPTYSTTSGGNNANNMTVLFSDPGLVNGTYTIQYGGTISGGSTVNGYNTGGTYSGGSNRSFTISSRLTTLSL